jgi:hypothetical protein
MQIFKASHFLLAPPTGDVKKMYPFRRFDVFDHFTPSTRFAYLRYEHSQRQYIGADLFIS